MASLKAKLTQFMIKAYFFDTYNELFSNALSLSGLAFPTLSSRSCDILFSKSVLLETVVSVDGNLMPPKIVVPY